MKKALIYQKNYYDSISKNYDELYSHEQEEKINDIIYFLKTKNLFNILINNSKKKLCLDIGVGTGVSSLWLKSYNFKIHGYDISEEMISKVKVKNKSGIYKTKAVEDIDFNQFRNDKFDLTIILSAFQNFTMQSEILNKIFLVSKAIILSEPKKIINKNLDKIISRFKEKNIYAIKKNSLKILRFNAGVDIVYLIYKN